MILKKLSRLLGLTLLAPLLSSGIASAAPATGTLSCMDASTSSNLIYIEFSGTGTTGANLYRYGAAHAIATYPNRDSGKGSFNDTGLSAGSTYHYELHSGSQVLATQNCTTKAVSSPPPAPAPTQSPPTTPTPTPPAQKPTPQSQPTSTAAPTPSSTTTTPTTRQKTSPTAIASTPVTMPVIEPPFEAQTDTPVANTPKPAVTFGPATVRPHSSTKNAPSNNTNVRTGLIAAACLVVGTCLILFGRLRTPAVEAVASPDYSGTGDTVSPPPIAPPIYLPAVPSDPITQGSNSAFYPPAQPPVQARKPSEPEDMYEVANKYPESFGNVHFLDNHDPGQHPS